MSDRVHIPKIVTEYCSQSQKFSEILKDTIQALSQARAKHSINTTSIAINIANELNINMAEKIKIGEACLLHDITKEQPQRYHTEILQNHKSYNIINEAPVKIWHSYSGAVYAKEKWKLEDEYCVAIQNHSTGKIGMSTISQIVYIADYMESMGITLTSKDMPINLNKWCLVKNKGTLLYLIEENLPVHFDSLEYYHHLIKIKNIDTT